MRRRRRHDTSPRWGEVGAEGGRGCGAPPLERFKQRARRLRASQTSAEARLWYALRNRKLARWKFRRQHSIDRFVVDFVTLEGKLVIEVDGATHATALELARDAERTRILESNGFLVLRVTNLDVYENLGGVLEAIDRTLRPQ
jgi:very-short-patch-repair endonuclease